MKHTRYCWLLLTAWWLLAGAGLAQEPPTSLSDYDAFSLWNECAPMWLLLIGPSGDAVDIGLSFERIRTLAESRLRVAQLYDAAALHDYHSPYLIVYVNVTVSEDRRSGAFSIIVSFVKHVLDVVSDRSGIAATWNTVSFGTYGGDAGYTLQAVSEELDEFILEYLRVNETACQ